MHVCKYVSMQIPMYKCMNECTVCMHACMHKRFFPVFLFTCMYAFML